MSMGTPQIQHAYWLGPRKGCVFLRENWAAPSPPEFVLASDSLRPVNVRFAPGDFSGRFTGCYAREDGAIVFCQEAERHPQIDFRKHPIRVAGPFNDWGRDGPDEQWRLKSRTMPDGTTLWECVVPRERLKVGDEGCPYKFVSSDWHWLKVLFCAPNRQDDHAGNVNYHFAPQCTGRHVLLFDVEGGRGIDGKVLIRPKNAPATEGTLLLPGLAFHDLATSLPLGARVEKARATETVFRLFAPRATGVSVEVFESLTAPKPQTHELALLEDELTWEARVPGSLHGWYYHLHVRGTNDGLSNHFNARQKILDPWALATVGAEGPAIVIDPARLPKTRGTTGFETPHWHDLVIVEAHVRDLVAQAPIKLGDADREGFSGLTAWVNTEGSYLRTLGVNALELLPVQQFDSKTRAEYHWGYMTNNYFSPCAHYARAPELASQIGELRELVEACHRHGLAVIFDVVYNHVGEPAFLLFIDKQYYAHVEPDGSLSNWSGCGNTVRPESVMARRLIIDSLLHLIETFDVDGFRFDLAELLTVEALCEIENALKAVKPSVVLIAEPWSFRGNIAWDLRSLGFSFWNDGYREFMANYVRGLGNAEGLRYFMKGSLDHLTTFPAQSVNYVESHDDRCWLDKITENAGHDGRNPTPHDVQRTHLVVAILMTSVGIPMLAAGMDFLRSKHGISNTYQRGDINALDYGMLERHAKTHAYFRGWIALRRSSWGELLRLWEKPGADYLRLFANESSPAAALLFNADHSHGNRQLLFAVNPMLDAIDLPLPDVAADGWVQLASRGTVDLTGLPDGRSPVSANGLHLDPLDCRLWVRQV